MNTVIVCPSCGAKNRIPEDKQHLTPKCGKCGTSLEGAPVSGKVNSLTDGGFNALVMEAKLPVLLDFYSPTCGPCQMITPVIEALAQDYTGKLLVFKLDTSTQQMTAAKFQIRGVPTLLFIQNGEVVDQLVGAVPRGDIEQRIQKMVG